MLVAGPDPLARRGLPERPIGIRWRQALKALRDYGFTCTRHRNPTPEELGDARRLEELVEALADRVYAQAELLAKRAEKAITTEGEP